MDKNVLRQYVDLQQEIRDLQRRIDKKKSLIKQMEEKGYSVKDTVKGTRRDGTIGTITVTGFPYPDYAYQKAQLSNSLMRMQLKQEQLLELTGEVEQFIDGIPDSRTRRIFRYRYLDSLSWVQVAHRMGINITDEGCRSTHDRYMGIKK